MNYSNHIKPELTQRKKEPKKDRKKERKIRMKEKGKNDQR